MRVGSVANQRCHLVIVQYEEKWYNKFPTRTLSFFANQPIHLAGIIREITAAGYRIAYLVFITEQQMSFRPMMRRHLA